MNWLLGAIAAGVVFVFGGDVKLPAFMQHKPPVAQYDATKAELAKSEAKLATAQTQLDANKAAQDAATKAQLDFTQQMGFGTLTAIQSIPADQQTVEIKLAEQFAIREQAGFEAARGKLSPEAQAEIKRMFDAAMAAKTAQVATLTAALADKDAALKAETSKRGVLELQAPALQAAVTTAKSETAVVAAKKEVLDKQIETYATTKAADDAKLGSLDHYGAVLLRIIVGLVLLFIAYNWIFHFALPNLAQNNPGGKADSFYQWIINLISSHSVTTTTQNPPKS